MLTRRLVLAGLACAALPVKARAQQLGPLSADDAHRQALAGEIVLVDVRSPEEWKMTGVAEGAERIWLRDPKLGEKLAEATGGDRDRPVALICATGARSALVGGAMNRAGYTTVYNVAEGMMGSAAGPGWLRRGLPVKKGVNSDSTQ